MKKILTLILLLTILFKVKGNTIKTMSAIPYFQSWAMVQPYRMEMANSNFYFATTDTIKKMNSNVYNTIWARKIPGVNFISTDELGNTYFAGIFSGTVNFNSWGAGYIMTAIGSPSLYVGKLDSNGNLSWIEQIGGIGSECFPWGLSRNKSGDLCLVGTFTGSIDFDPGPNQTILNNGYHFILKLDTSGAFQWAKELQLPQFSPLVPTFSFPNCCISNDGSITYSLIVPYWPPYVFDIDPGPNVYQISIPNSGSGLMIHLDSIGNFMWGGTTNYAVEHIKSDSNNNIITAGKSGGIPININGWQVDSHSFIAVKYSSTGVFE